MLGWVWSCAYFVGNVWMTVLVGGDVGATDSAGREGCPISYSDWSL